MAEQGQSSRVKSKKLLKVTKLRSYGGHNRPRPERYVTQKKKNEVFLLEK